MTNRGGTPAHFDFQGHDVRVLTIDGEPWWVAADVAAVLQLAHVHSTLRALDDDEKAVHKGYGFNPHPGGDQALTIISESGLYSLVLRSRKPEAKIFRRWITHEVIPAIRKTGRYSTDDRQVPDYSTETIDVIKSAARVGLEALLGLARNIPVDAADSIMEVLFPPNHAIPEEAVTFSDLAEIFSWEFDRPDLGRDQLLAIAHDAGFLVQPPPPASGATLADRRLSGLFAVRRLGDSTQGWAGFHHHQPLALPEGIAIMRQLVASQIDRGEL
jgi:prophage antirepressor-like protein